MKNKDYYLRALVKRNEALKKAIDSINVSNKSDNEVAKQKRLSKNRLAIALINFDILNVQYSADFPINELKTQLLKTVKLFVDSWDRKVVKLHVGRNQKESDVYLIEYYIRLRWLFSLSILLDFSFEEFNSLVNIYKNDNVNDGLIDFFINSRNSDWIISEELNIKKPKNRILQIVSIYEKQDCERELKNYLEKEWLKTYKNYSMYNTHLQDEQKYFYLGYWAFEVAAIVKIKNLNDSTFRNNKYYPNTLL